MGAQMRRIQNLRLMVGRMDALLSPANSVEEETAMHMQMAVTLYSRNLTGIVLLVDLDDVPSYKLGLGNAQGKPKTLQFLFTSKLYTQRHVKRASCTLLILNNNLTWLSRAWQRIPMHRRTAMCSLPNTLILPVLMSSSIYALIPQVSYILYFTSKSVDYKKELTQRTPLIQGLKNILTLAHRYEVKQLTVPVLLLPDTSLIDEQKPTPVPGRSSPLMGNMSRSSSLNALNVPNSNMFTDEVLVKRAEIILKSIKGVMLELSRSYGKYGETRHGGASASDSAQDSGSTLVFMVATWLARESTFEAMQNMLRSVFRTF